MRQQLWLLAKDLADFLGEIGRRIRLLQPRTRPNTRDRRLGIPEVNKTFKFGFTATAASANSSLFMLGITMSVKSISTSG
jgi:hypothetical protein